MGSGIQAIISIDLSKMVLVKHAALFLIAQDADPNTAGSSNTGTVRGEKAGFGLVILPEVAFTVKGRFMAAIRTEFAVISSSYRYP